VSPIKAIEVNGASTDRLDYNRRDYPNGRSIIAVGGLTLSRGLTLEGLSTSYFLRNSVMYDTLMQMGRWFGYRTDFEDLCRIYMTEEASSWYGHISRVIEELRDEFKRMEKAKMTPRDFGLCVRSHPETLIVTARNKMRTARSVPRQINLEGRLVETSILLKTPEIVTNNFQALDHLVTSITDTPASQKDCPGYLYQNIDSSLVIRFVESFINHPASQLTDPKPVTDYIRWLAGNNLDKWDVYLVSLEQKSKAPLIVDIVRHKIVCQRRTVGNNFPGNGIEFKKRRVGYSSQEKAGLLPETIKAAESNYSLENPDRKNFPGSIYRSKRDNPLLILHVLDCHAKSGNQDEIGEPLFSGGIVGYGISFPGESGTRRPKKLVEYMVNTVWWQNNYADLLDNEEEYNE